MNPRHSRWIGSGVLALAIVLLTTACSTTTPRQGPPPVSPLESEEAVAKNALNCVATGLAAVLDYTVHEKDRVQIIREFVNPVRYFNDRSGYFFVYDYDGVCIAHPIDPGLVGKKLLDLRDCRGTLVVRKCIELAEQGGGTYEYYWMRPGDQKEEPKIGYVMPLAETRYWIGTGVYLR